MPGEIPERNQTPTDGGALMPVPLAGTLHPPDPKASFGRGPVRVFTAFDPTSRWSFQTSTPWAGRRCSTDQPPT